jgi:hypothetical protein
VPLVALAPYDVPSYTVATSPSAQPGSVVWQTRLSGDAAALYERDLQALGLDRSEALRRGLRLLHREALEVQMARDIEDFYGGARAPLSEVTAKGYGLRREAPDGAGPMGDDAGDREE